MTEVKTWRAPRMWKGKSVDIYLRSAGKADLYRSDASDLSLGPAFTVYDPALSVVNEEDGIGVHTDARWGNHVDRRLMGEGKANGLEERTDHLSGRCILAKALSLAVHLGASTVVLYGTVNLEPRERRNVATMVRPLKGRRVRVYDADDCLGLFPSYGLEE